METDYLREMLMLAEKCNYAEAADELFISQSSLSRHISAMEEKLGVKLFNRNSRFVRITPAGEQLVPYAKKIVRIENDYKLAVEAERNRNLTKLKIACAAPLSAYRVQSSLAAFIVENENIGISMSSRKPYGFKEMIKNGDCDFAVIYDDEAEPDDSLDRLRIDTDRMTLILPEGHELAEKKSVSLSSLKDEKWIFYGERKFYRRNISMLFKKANFEPKLSPVNVSGIDITELVAAGTGISIEMEKLAKRNPTKGVVWVELEEADIFYVNLVWQQKLLSPAGRKFIGFMKRSYRSTSSK